MLRELDNPSEGPSRMGEVRLGLQEGSQAREGVSSLGSGELAPGDRPSRLMKECSTPMILSFKMAHGIQTSLKNPNPI